jgi:hypothetical protein
MRDLQSDLFTSSESRPYADDARQMFCCRSRARPACGRPGSRVPVSRRSASRGARADRCRFGGSAARVLRWIRTEPNPAHEGAPEEAGRRGLPPGGEPVPRSRRRFDASIVRSTGLAYRPSALGRMPFLSLSFIVGLRLKSCYRVIKISSRITRESSCNRNRVRRSL